MWEGDGVVKAGRTILGATKPSESAPGTVRYGKQEEGEISVGGIRGKGEEG